MRTEDLFPLVLPEVLGCPHPTLIAHASLAAQRLCIEAGVWQALTEPVTTTAGQSNYEIELPSSNAQLVRIRDLWLDGALLRPIQAKTIPGHSSSVQGYTFVQGHEEVTLHSDTGGGQELVMRIVLAPKPNATNLDDSYAPRHLSALAAGTKASLMLIPGQSWSNPQLGQHYQHQFAAAIADARIDSIKDSVDTTLTVNRRPFS